MTCWGKRNLRGWNTDWAITWGTRCSVMFICVKTKVKRKEWSRSLAFRSAIKARHESAARHGSDTGTGAARGRSTQCLCWVYTSTFLKHPRSGFQGIKTAICHATSKTVKNSIYYLNLLERKKKKKYCSLFVPYTCVPKQFGTNTCTVTPLVFITLC